MTTSAVIMMVTGMLIIWGGFLLSVANMVIKSKKA